MVTLSLTSVDELIAARRSLHGGSRGAPKKGNGGQHEGAALNRACVVMLSSTLQAFVEDVFLECSEKAFGHAFSEPERKNYYETWNRWGNPNDQNITALFRRLGVDDVFSELSWSRQSTSDLKKNLKQINQIRNCISHGKPLKFEKSPFSLKFTKIQRWRDIAEQFGRRFPKQALSKIR